MPHEFVKRRIGSADLAIAVRQQEQLSYFTQSSIQEDLPESYFNDWADRKHATDDRFLNHAKNIFREDNFTVFAKFLRSPIISAELVDDRIKPELERVFFSENSYFNYSIRGENMANVDELDSKKFDKTLFNALLFNHNDIVVINVPQTNSPKREIISIKNVVAIESHDSVISRLAYSVIFNGQRGFLYMDEFIYAFLDEKSQIVGEPILHDLGECPADYVSNEAFSSDSDIIRKSIFSKTIRRMENYVVLDTMLRMTEPNGVIPVITMLKSKQTQDGNDTKAQEGGEPMTAAAIGGQQANEGKTIQSSNNLAQSGSTIITPVIRKDDGSIDMEVVKNYLNYFHMPTEPLKFIEGRVDKQERNLLLSIIGDFSEGNEPAMNELQVSKGYKSKEDRLRDISVALTVIRKASDFKFLALENGKDNVTVDLFFGSDFFTESQEDLFKLFKDSPNPIERRNILMKSTRNRNRFNPQKQKEEIILNHLLPYCSDTDFDKAVEQQAVSAENYTYQSRFNYWIASFEAQFGSVVSFWDGMEDMDNSSKIMVINSLVLDIISDSNKAVAEDDNSAAKNAQAALRGSVGGVTGAISMLQFLPEEQAIEMLIAFYGYDKETAKKIAKKPEGEGNGEQQNNLNN